MQGHVHMCIVACMCGSCVDMHVYIQSCVDGRVFLCALGCACVYGVCI